MSRISNYSEDNKCLGKEEKHTMDWLMLGPVPSNVCDSDSVGEYLPSLLPSLSENSPVMGTGL